MTYNQLAVLAAKAGIPKAQWIPGRAALARDDETTIVGILHAPRVSYNFAVTSAKWSFSASSRA
jgi:hypothetical protein